MDNAFANYKLPISPLDENGRKYAHYEWQDRTAQVIKELKIPKKIMKNGKKVNPQSSFFKWCKTNRVKFEAAYNYTKEKNKGWLYFAWIMTHEL